jgi:hypothetical protein
MVEYNIEEMLKTCDEKWLIWLRDLINKEIQKRKNAPKNQGELR